MKPKTQTIQV